MNDLNEKLTAAATTMDMVVSDLEAAMRIMSKPTPQGPSATERMSMMFLKKKLDEAKALRFDLFTVVG
jgi:hypothetical protein